MNNLHIKITLSLKCRSLKTDFLVGGAMYERTYLCILVGFFSFKVNFTGFIT